MSECARALPLIALAAPHLRVVLPQRSVLAFCAHVKRYRTQLRIEMEG